MRKAQAEREVLSIGKVVFESALIVVSVVLGFVISEWGTHIKERELAANVRRSVALEVAENMKTIEPQMTRHYVAATALDQVQPQPGKTALKVLAENLPGGSIAALPMKRAAWDAAVSSGALRLLDRDLVERYSHIYVTQEQIYDDDIRWLKTTLYRPENFDPAQQKVAVDTLAGVLSELAGNESILHDLYKNELPVLQQAAR